MNRSISIISVLIVGSIAEAQVYRAGAGGCTLQVSSSPVSVAGCQNVGGCAGTSRVLDIGAAASAPSGVSAEYVSTIPFWMNFCGGAHYSGAGAIWVLPVVFSGPTSTVQVRAQVDYEWTFEASGTSGGANPRCRVGVGLGANQNAQSNDLFGQYLTGPSVGRLIHPPVTLQTGVPYVVAISIDIDQGSGVPVSGVAVTDSLGIARLPSVGPIFILPDGYTANSTVLGIVNNQFPPPPCEGDADGDFMVNFGDITNVLTNWGANYAPASGPGDSNHDGVVDFADITNSLGNWGSACP